MSDGLAVALAKSAEDAWESLVRGAVHCPDVDRFISEVAKWTRTKPQGVRAKVRAIRAECLRGATVEEIIAMGQGECISRHAQARKAARAGDPDRTLSFTMPRSLADAWQNPNASADQVEPIITRLARVCELETTEDLFDYLKALIDDIPDEIHAQLAGVIPRKEWPRGRQC